MTKNFYVLYQNKNQQDINQLEGVIYDEPINMKISNYGYKPWYIYGNSGNSSFNLYKNKMYFIGNKNNKNWIFNFMHGSNGNYFMSQKFWEICTEFDIDISESSDLYVKDFKKNDINDYQYKIVRFKEEIYLSKSEVFKKLNQGFFEEEFYIESGEFKTVNKHLFKLKNHLNNCFFCSEDFYQACLKFNIKDIDFVNFKNIKWLKDDDLCFVYSENYISFI